MFFWRIVSEFTCGEVWGKVSKVLILVFLEDSI